MNKTICKILSAFGVAATALLFTACDDVREDDRYIDMGAIEADRAVLLEDFTGQMCINCPDAHEVIEQLEQQYGRDKVIAVSIHCGGFGLPVESTNFDKNSVFLMTKEGNTIMDSYGITSWPMGVIDGGSTMTYDLWPTAVREALATPTDVTIDLQAKYVEGENDSPENGYTGTIEISAEIMSGSDFVGNVQFWIVEDGIVALQRRTTTTIPDYVHNNVFRAQVFGGIKGEALTLQHGVEKTVTGQIESRWTASERWEVKNLSVVAFVSNSNGVQQAKRVFLFDQSTTETDTPKEE